MAYNLPPPWDAGYALPDNVRDEGLERRGFVTKQMPRGTYDQPSVGTGGYAVPQYVMDEGYGQGTFTTKWEPRGEYDGGRIPHWLNDRPKLVSSKRVRGARDLVIAAPVTVMPYGRGKAVAMSGSDPHPPGAEDYGNKAAAYIINRVSIYPPAQRKAQLKKMLNSIDKSLMKRTTDIAKELVAKGCTPGQALRMGLARAMTAGMTAELIRLGQSRSLPQPGSPRGLGYYRGQKTALGADLQLKATGGTVATGITCAGYSWSGTAWVRTKAGSPDVAGPINGVCPAGVTAHPTTLVGPNPLTGAQIQAINDAAAAEKLKAAATQMVDIGGRWSVPADAKTYAMTFHRPEDLAWAKDQFFKNLPHVAGTAGHGGYFSLKYGKVDNFMGWGKDLLVPDLLVDGSYPLATSMHPVFNKKYGLYLTNPVSNGAASSFTLVWKEVPLSWLGEIVGWIDDVISTIRDVIHSLVKDIICKPGASDAAKSTPNPYVMAAGVGMEVAKNEGVCGPSPLPPLPPATTFPFLPVAIAGGAVVAAIYFLKKKKAHP